MASAFDGSSLRAYRQNLAGFSPLDRQTERDLARAWRAGDNGAGERIVEACLPFVIAIALEYRRWGIPLEDIVQQGNLGLLRAAKKFDPEREVRLATEDPAQVVTRLPERQGREVARRGDVLADGAAREEVEAVSYTHLTLPTSDLV